MDPFYRIQRLPGYVFTQVQDLKLQARKRGEDIIDLGKFLADGITVIVLLLITYNIYLYFEHYKKISKKL